MGCEQFTGLCAQIPFPAALVDAASTIIGFAIVRAVIRILRG